MKYEDYPLLEQLKEKDKQFIKQIQLKIAKEHIASGKGKILSFE